MALTDAERMEAARALAEEMFSKSNTMAHLNLDQLKAAITSIDTAMGTVINAIPGAWANKTIKQALIDNLPEPFQSASNAQQKAKVLSLWAMKEAGMR